MILLDLRMMPLAALVPLLRRALELYRVIVRRAGLTRTIVAAFAAACYASARLLLDVWWTLTNPEL